MECTVSWTGGLNTRSGMGFVAETGSGHTLTMDGAPDAARPIPWNRLEWEHLQRVLAEHQGNIAATARALGMHRRTLQRKLAKRPSPGGGEPPL